MRDLLLKIMDINKRRQVIKIVKNESEMLYFFIDISKNEFPVIAKPFTDVQENQLMCLKENFPQIDMNTEELCQYLIDRKIKYIFAYPFDKKDIFKGPTRYLHFLMLERSLNKYKKIKQDM